MLSISQEESYCLSPLVVAHSLQRCYGVTQELCSQKEGVHVHISVQSLYSALSKVLAYTLETFTLTFTANGKPRLHVSG